MVIKCDNNNVGGEVMLRVLGWLLALFLAVVVIGLSIRYANPYWGMAGLVAGALAVDGLWTGKLYRQF